MRRANNRGLPASPARNRWLKWLSSQQFAFSHVKVSIERQVLDFRILDEPKSTSTRSRRVWGAGLLLLALLALVLGVFGAVYFQGHGSAPQIASQAPPSTPPQSRPETPSASTSSPAAPPAESQPQTPAAAPDQSAPPALPIAPETAQAPPAISSAPPVVPSENLLQNQSPRSELSPEKEAQRLSQISPSAAPANVAAAAPRYWVEFGAYEGSFYADRLKQSLGKLGIDARITSATGKHGRRYLRVRTARDSDRAMAENQLAQARSALRIKPLLHRIAAASPGAVRLATPSSARRHWVQFGAFRMRSNAKQTAEKLRRNKIEAFVLETKNSDRASLYLVRVSGLSDRAAAARIARQGGVVLRSHDVLIGESPIAPGLHPQPPPR